MISPRLIITIAGARQVGRGGPIDRLDETLEIGKHGRFLIILVSDGDQGDEILQKGVDKARRVSNID